MLQILQDYIISDYLSITTLHSYAVVPEFTGIKLWYMLYLLRAHAKF